MMPKTCLVLITLLSSTALALDEDLEILQDLEFFKSFHLVKNLSHLEEEIPAPKNPPFSKKTEVTNGTH
jgi:hypothetical protein